MVAEAWQQLGAQYSMQQAEASKRMRRWHDEQPLLEAAIMAMTQTVGIIKKEQVAVVKELSSVQAALAKQAADAAAAAVAAGGSAAGSSGGNQGQQKEEDDLDLASQLAQLTSKVWGS